MFDGPQNGGDDNGDGCAGSRRGGVACQRSRQESSFLCGRDRSRAHEAVRARCLFRIADGYAGHTAILALFHRKTPVEQAHSTVDHLTFTIALADYEAEMRRLETLGLTVVTATHEWVHWRSLYIADPDGNEVELVCYDPEV